MSNKIIRVSMSLDTTTIPFRVMSVMASTKTLFYKPNIRPIPHA